MSFGRKGLTDAPRLTPAQAMALRARPAATSSSRATRRDPDESDAISPALAAFLTAERARKGSEPGLSDLATAPSAHLGRQRSGAVSYAAPRAAAVPSDWSRSAVSTHRAARTLGVAYMLWLVTGGFGGHRHYLGRHGSALVQAGLFLAGLALIALSITSFTAAMMFAGIALATAAGWWIIVDAFLIPGMVRAANAVEGPPAGD